MKRKDKMYLATCLLGFKWCLQLITNFYVSIKFINHIADKYITGYLASEQDAL